MAIDFIESIVNESTEFNPVNNSPNNNYNFLPFNTKITKNTIDTSRPKLSKFIGVKKEYVDPKSITPDQKLASIGQYEAGKTTGSVILDDEKKNKFPKYKSISKIFANNYKRG
jgi:hypothetical protein